ncbi:MAG: hypothetical protein U5M23_02260, partial [Marinagarivorans sp.]|nr:hypothetical protein [Marinagarivorans sp.]
YVLLVINGTSASLHGELPPVPASILPQAQHDWRLRYGLRQRAHALLLWAEANKVPLLCDGLGDARRPSGRSV